MPNDPNTAVPTKNAVSETPDHCANVGTAAPDPAIDDLAELQVRRRAYIRAANRCTNAAGALARRAFGWAADADPAARARVKTRAAALVDAAMRVPAAALADAGAFLDALLAATDPADRAVVLVLADDLATFRAMAEPARRARRDVERQMARAAKALPVWPWAAAVRGLGPLGLAVIVGEAGDLAGYPTAGHLRKRFGLAPHEGRAASTWRKAGGLDADAWTALGYAPARRAEMYAVIGLSLIRAGGPYRDLFLARCGREHEKAREEGLLPATTTAATVASWAARGLPPLAKVARLDPRLHRGAGHMTIRAQRYTEQRLLQDLWKAWRRANRIVCESTRMILPAATTGERAAERTLSHDDCATTMAVPPAPPPAAAGAP